jgi:hypothetical protein
LITDFRWNKFCLFCRKILKRWNTPSKVKIIGSEFWWSHLVHVHEKKQFFSKQWKIVISCYFRLKLFAFIFLIVKCSVSFCDCTFAFLVVLVLWVLRQLISYKNIKSANEQQSIIGGIRKKDLANNLVTDRIYQSKFEIEYRLLVIKNANNLFIYQ